jgi:hypothetical protein
MSGGGLCPIFLQTWVSRYISCKRHIQGRKQHLKSGGGEDETHAIFPIHVGLADQNGGALSTPIYYGVEGWGLTLVALKYFFSSLLVVTFLVFCFHFFYMINYVL